MLRLPNHLRRRREKVFGDGPRMPLDREAKVRIKHLARALKHKTEKGKHYGQLTGKFVDVLDALLWLIHDGRSGQCNPSYDTIADKAGCCPATVCSAIHAPEICGILSWVNRITRIRERERDLFGHTVLVWKVVRTSNAYTFRDPKASIPPGESSKSKFQSGPLDKQKNTTKPQPSELFAHTGRRDCWDYRPLDEAMRRGRAELGIPEPKALQLSVPWNILPATAAAEPPLCSPMGARN